jgi:hypothetical protein
MLASLAAAAALAAVTRRARRPEDRQDHGPGLGRSERPHVADGGGTGADR